MDQNAESDSEMKKKIQKTLRPKDFHERRKNQAVKFQELGNELGMERKDKAEIARERDQLEVRNKKLKIEIEQLRNKNEELTNENGELKRIVGGNVRFVSIGVSQNWGNG
jgi:septal ring factor EnvC (AmiA/AmiB activator)